jgi:hypothetical protein
MEAADSSSKLISAGHAKNHFPEGGILDTIFSNPITERQQALSVQRFVPYVTWQIFRSE